MFRDAAEMMDSNPTDCHRSHVTAFRWEGDEPVLTERVLSTGEERRLGIDPLDLFVSEARRCVGKRDGTMCCSEPQPRMHHCRSCDPFPVPECRFQPRCHGTMCDGTVCGDDHVVYLALFAENPKVGMTRAERLRERGMEQGADMIVPLQTHPSRRQAREAEQNLSKQKGIPQSMPVQTAVGCLGDDAGELAAEKWEAMSSSLETCGDPLVLDGYPLHGIVSTPG